MSTFSQNVNIRQETNHLYRIIIVIWVHTLAHAHTLGLLMYTNVLVLRITQTHKRTRGPYTQNHTTISFRQLLKTGSEVQRTSLRTPVCARLWSNSGQTSVTSTVDERSGGLGRARCLSHAGRRWAACDVTSEAQHVVAPAIKQPQGIWSMKFTEQIDEHSTDK